MEPNDENLVDEAPAVSVGVNRTASDMSTDEWERLTPEQREALDRADRGELPVDARSPLYNEPAAENFVHSIDPRVAAGELIATDTSVHEQGDAVESGSEFEGNGPAEHLALAGDEVPPGDD